MASLTHLPSLTIATYLALFATVLSLWLGRRIWMASATAAIALALAAGVLTLMGLISVIALLAAAFGSRVSQPAIRYLSVTAVLSLALALGLHVLPGFHNPRIIDEWVITPGAVPYTLYLNFDKTFAGIAILGLTYGSLLSSRDEWRRAIMQAAPIVPIAVVILMGASLALGYVELAPKWRDVFLVWAPVNLLFTSMSEEAFFRGFLPRRLATVMNSWMALVITAMLFGLAHAGGGWMYVVLATLAGLSYGYVYQRSESIEMAMLTHFAVNTTHILFFTYPAAA